MIPKISIIVPNFNHKAFLKERLHTIFEQTFQDFEVILLDDASTDGSQEILEQYKDHLKVAHLILNTQNSGSPFKQWKKGINLAKGEYVWIAESDDTNSLSFLDTCLEQVLETPNLGIITTSLSIFDQHKSEVFKALEEGAYDGLTLIQQKMLRGNNIRNASGVIFLRKAVNDEILNGITKFKICGDWWLWLNILKENNLYFIDSPLTNYRKHKTATTSNLSNNPLFYIEANMLLQAIIEWKCFNSMIIDKSVSFWIKKIKKSNIPKSEMVSIEKKYSKLLSRRAKVNILKKVLYKLIAK